MPQPPHTPRRRAVVFSALSHEASAFTTEQSRRPDLSILNLVFIRAALDPTTAALAAGAFAVVLSLTDRADAPVLAILATRGVRLLILRMSSPAFVDLRAATRLGLRVAPAPAHPAPSIAEYAVALILALVRRVPAAARDSVHAHHRLVGFDVAGKTVGIVGTGRVGAAVVRILAAFACQILVFDVAPSPAVRALGAVYVPLRTLLATSDIISLHAPLVPGTHHLLGRDALARCKRGVHIVNTARGGLIDTRAAIDALQSGQLGALALDAYEGEDARSFRSANAVQSDPQFQLLTSMPNVLITGRQAAFTTNAIAAVVRATFKTLLQYCRGEDLEYEHQPNV